MQQARVACTGLNALPGIGLIHFADSFALACAFRESHELHGALLQVLAVEFFVRAGGQKAGSLALSKLSHRPDLHFIAGPVDGVRVIVRRVSSRLPKLPQLCLGKAGAEQ